MPDLAEIARRAGVTEAQARAVLDAAAAVERPAPAAMNDFATWAAGVVVVASVAVFMFAEDGFEVDPDGKGAVLAVTLVIAAGAVAAARAARARGYRLGEQIGFTVAAALVPVIVWTLLWVAGVWPGHVVHQPDYSYWDSQGHDREKAALLALVAASAAAAMAYPALKLGAALAWGVWLGCLQALLGTVVAAIDPDIDFPDGLDVLLTGIYLAVFTALALALERSQRDRAGWTWPWAWLAGGVAFVSVLADNAADGLAWAVGLGLVVAAAVGGGTLQRPQLVVAAGLGGITLDVWLYDLLDFGAGGALVVSLLLGLAVVGLTVLTWKRLSPPGGIRASS
jgi:hypothetical protein